MEQTVQVLNKLSTASCFLPSYYSFFKQKSISSLASLFRYSVNMSESFIVISSPYTFIMFSEVKSKMSLPTWL